MALGLDAAFLNAIRAAELQETIISGVVDVYHPCQWFDDLQQLSRNRLER